METPSVELVSPSSANNDTNFIMEDLKAMQKQFARD
ncbi:hypothetical protein C5167_030532 [Papaver somniferum]|nr:hypothetical protein C5167_030532 [Papaver somniferum]